MAKADLDDIEIDVGALKKRYAEEREKRIRPDAIHQYQEAKGEFAHFAQDPWTDPNFTRDPVIEDVDVLIIGGGLGGLLAGCYLRQRGIKSMRIIDKAGDFGGTWYWNRYPGCACDVDAYIYLPLLEEIGHIPTEKYAKAGEIYEHCRRTAQHFDLYTAALFQTEVHELCWDPERKRWIVSTDRKDRIAARFIVSCTGLLSKPKLPGIPGIETFAGRCFHTSRWNYKYTGGDEKGNMTGLNDKIVGVIGTGSTGIQVVPAVAKDAKHLYVFQRSPSSVDYRGNKPTDPEWVKTLKPGWYNDRMINFSVITSGYARAADLIDDAWTEIMKIVAPPGDGETAIDPAAVQVAEMKKMEHMRRRIDEIVRDPEVAEALKPYYHYGCKRPTFSDEYLQAYNRPNVTLVDTKGKGIERITPNGAVVEGKEYNLDCLIFATGFDFMREYGRQSGMKIYGRGGRPLSEHWSEGARTLFGMQTHGFPNFFLMNLIQAGVSQNYTHTADEQTKHIAYIISECMQRSFETVEPTKEAEDAWVKEILSLCGSRREFMENCIPSYYSYEGKRDPAYELNDLYMGGPIQYFENLKAWRNAGNMPGLDTTKQHDAS